MENLFQMNFSKNQVNAISSLGLAHMGDGVFELLLIRAPKDLLELNECVWAVQKQKYNCAMMTFVSTRELTVFPDPQMDWTSDGERCGGAQCIHVENLHHAIRLMRRV